MDLEVDKSSTNSPVNEVPSQSKSKRYNLDDADKRKKRAQYQREFRARRSTRDSTKLNKDFGVEYQRKYRLRKKLESAIDRCGKVPSDPPTSGNELSTTLSSTSKTDDEQDVQVPSQSKSKRYKLDDADKRKKRAQYQREFRARRSTRDSTKLNKDFGVEYQRKYRLRKKLESAIGRCGKVPSDPPTVPSGNEPSTTLSSASKTDEQDVHVPSQLESKQHKSDDDDTTIADKRKKRVQHQREFRPRRLRKKSDTATDRCETVQDVQPLPSSSIHAVREGDNGGDREVNIATANYQEELRLSYSRFDSHKRANEYFKTKFVANRSRFPCAICDRLWFQYDLVSLPACVNQDLIDILLPGITRENIRICSACATSLRANKMPTFAVYNGLKYPSLPKNLPPLDIITERLISPRIDSLSARQTFSIVSFNYRSLKAHVNDLTDTVIQRSNILMLSEKFMDSNELPVSVPNLDFVVRFQRQEKRNSGVAICHRKDDHCYIITPHLHIQAPYANDRGVVVSSSASIGDLCAIECATTHDRRHKLILIAVYISPNTSMRDIKAFIGKALMSLSKEGSQLLARMLGEPVEYSNQEVILAGDFNVNFSLPQAEPLLEFLEEHFSLRMINGRNDPTTKDGTTIDAVFARNLGSIELKHFV